MTEIDLEQARRRAKELLRAARAGDAHARAQMRDDRAPRLTDAQRAVARELGFQSWPALVEHLRVTSPGKRAIERRDELLVTDLSYTPERPVRIRLRRREHRYDIDDMGEAVALAGRPPGWEQAAARAVERLGWNITREGVVLMHAVEGRDIGGLVRRTAEASVAVFDAVLETEEQPERRRTEHR